MEKNGDKKAAKNEVLSLWRSLGFLDELKEGGIIEWRCAKSFDLMARFLLAEENANNKELQNWNVAIFPIIRRCIAKNKHRITRVIKPEELIGFLTENNIGDSLRYVYSLRGKNKFKYMVECFSRYLKLNGKLNDPLINLLTIFDGEKRERMNEIFGGDYEAEVCAFVSDYFCSCTSKKK